MRFISHRWWSFLTPPLAEFDRVCISGATGIPVSVGYQALPYTLEYYESFVGQPFLHPFSKSSGLTEQSGFRSESNNPVWYKIHRMIIAMIIRPGRVLNSQIIVLSPIKNQPFGSMPRCCSSLRSMRLIQVARDESPSLRISSSNCERNSSLNRIWYCGDFFSSCIDTCNYPSYHLNVTTRVITFGLKSNAPECGNTTEASHQTVIRGNDHG